FPRIQAVMAALGPVPSIIQRSVVDAALTAFSLHGLPPPPAAGTNPNTGSTRPAWLPAGGSTRICPASWGPRRKIGTDRLSQLSSFLWPRESKVATLNFALWHSILPKHNSL